MATTPSGPSAPIGLRTDVTASTRLQLFFAVRRVLEELARAEPERSGPARRGSRSARAGSSLEAAAAAADFNAGWAASSTRRKRASSWPGPVRAAPPGGGGCLLRDRGVAGGQAGGSSPSLALAAAAGQVLLRRRLPRRRRRRLCRERGRAALLCRQPLREQTPPRCARPLAPSKSWTHPFALGDGGRVALSRQPGAWGLARREAGASFGRR